MDTLYDKDDPFLRLDIGRVKYQNGRVYNNIQIWNGTKKELTDKLKELGYKQDKSF